MDLKKEDNLNNVSVKQKTRMAAVVPKYSPLLYTVLFLLLIDFVINSFSELLLYIPIAMLVIYIVQDICILFTALVLLIMLINTYMFQAGLMGYMITKFKSVWILSLVYFGLCLGIQIWITIVRWEKPLEFSWQPGQVVLYVLQRSCAIIYYYMFKRTAYRLSDSRFYEDSDWLRKEFERRN
ncbi:unnamed protein product [Brachionus calyciflorus]|uniref:Transmembrane protein 138 n=1 Tax=Brachionus calyciflorus TaxID=104777 RepID=A0A813WVY8_9BILA|nr:unnamed protein product [Brachionus calyciflorus]